MADLDMEKTAAIKGKLMGYMSAVSRERMPAWVDEWMGGLTLDRSIGCMCIALPTALGFPDPHFGQKAGALRGVRDVRDGGMHGRSAGSQIGAEERAHPQRVDTGAAVKR